LSQSKTFCAVPWTQMATNASGFYRFCCNATPGKNLVQNQDGQPFRVENTSAEAVWNSKHYKSFRKQFLNGEEPEMCERCFREEKSGVESARQKMNRKWEGQYDPSSEDVAHVKYIDLRLGNLCNLKCRMCNPYASSKWVDEWNQVVGAAELVPNNPLTEAEALRLKKLDWPDKDATWENLKPVLNQVEEIYLTGGEPLLSLKQKELLDHFIESGISKNIRLKYNTNLTVLPEDLIKRWASFKKVVCNVSIDGVGPFDEYIRFPTKWSVVEKNLRQLIQLEREGMPLQIGVHVTVQMYNILHLSEVLDFLMKEFKIQPFLNILNHPHCYNIRTLPPELKSLAKSRLQDYLDFDKVLEVIRYMEHEDWSQTHLTEFYKVSAAMDQVRDQKLESLVPEFFNKEAAWSPQL